MNTATSFANVEKEILKWVYVGNEININLEAKLKKIRTCTYRVIVITVTNKTSRDLAVTTDNSVACLGLTMFVISTPEIKNLRPR